MGPVAASVAMREGGRLDALFITELRGEVANLYSLP